MEDWTTELFKNLETLNGELVQFLEGVSREIVEAVDRLAKISDEVAEEFWETIAPEVEQYLEQCIDTVVQPILEALVGSELLEEILWPEDPPGESEAIRDNRINISSIQMVPQEYPACQGCRHYHGQSYGGNYLVCGMHPYGWVDEHCPDWESPWE